MKWFSRIWNIENIKVVRRVIVSVVGATVLLIGVALLVLPGPAFIVIPIGLAILARVRVGAALAKKSSSNGERRGFPWRPRNPRKFQGLNYLVPCRVNQSLRVSVTTSKPCANDDS